MSDIKEIMAEWLQLKAQLKSARVDLGVLNKREKQLKQSVETFMKSQATEEGEKVEVKVHGQKISFSSKNVRGSMTKEAVIAGLRAFFGGDETRVEGAFQAIEDAIPVKERNTLSVRKNGN
jgi:hypothetical protein